MTKQHDELVKQIKGRLILGKPSEYDISIIGTGSVGFNAYLAALTTNHFDLEEVKKIYIAPSREDKSKEGKKKIQGKLDTLLQLSEGFKNAKRFQGPVTTLPFSEEDNLRTIFNTQISVLAFGSNAYNPNAADSEDERQLQQAIRRSLEEIIDPKDKNDKDYRILELLPGNISPIIRWAKNFKSNPANDKPYEGHIILCTNPPDILSYIFAAYSGLTNQISGFGPDTWRLRNNIIHYLLRFDKDILKGLTLEKAFALGDHGGGLVACLHDVDPHGNINDQRQEIQQKMRSYAQDNKPNNNDLYIRAEIECSLLELYKAVIRDKQKVPSSAFSSLQDFLAEPQIEIEGSLLKERIFNGVVVDYDFPRSKISHIHLEKEAEKDLIESYRKLSNIISAIRKVIDIPEVTPQPEPETPIIVSSQPTLEGRLLAEESSGSILVYDLKTQSYLDPINPLNKEKEDFLNFTISEGSLFFIKSDKIEKFNINSAQFKNMYERLKGNLSSCTNFKGKLYAVLEDSDSGYILSWESYNQEPKIEFESESVILSLDICSIQGETNIFATVGNDVYRWIGDFNSSPEIYHSDSQDSLDELEILPDQNLIFARDNKKVYSWHVGKDNPYRTINSDFGGYAVNNEDGKIKIYTPLEKKVIKHDLDSEEKIDVNGSFDSARDIKSLDNCLYIASGNRIHIIDISKNEEIRVIKSPDSTNIYSLRIIK